MAFTFQKLEISEVVLIQPDVHTDKRGSFSELYKMSEFKKYGIDSPFVQFNNSYSKKHVLRGIHYQINPYAQGKLVSVAFGEVFDVAVDIRRGSPTFGKWVSQILSDRDRSMMYVPVGFAHGFCVLSGDANVRYYCTEEYSPDYERGIIWDDPAIGIDWPTDTPVLSDKDQRHPALESAENNFEYEK